MDTEGAAARKSLGSEVAEQTSQITATPHSAGAWSCASTTDQLLDKEVSFFSKSRSGDSAAFPRTATASDLAAASGTCLVDKVLATARAPVPATDAPCAAAEAVSDGPEQEEGVPAEALLDSPEEGGVVATPQDASGVEDGIARPRRPPPLGEIEAESAAPVHGAPELAQAEDAPNPQHSPHAPVASTKESAAASAATFQPLQRTASGHAPPPPPDTGPGAPRLANVAPRPPVEPPPLLHERPRGVSPCSGGGSGSPAHKCPAEVSEGMRPECEPRADVLEEGAKDVEEDDCQRRVPDCVMLRMSEDPAELSRATASWRKQYDQVRDKASSLLRFYCGRVEKRPCLLIVVYVVGLIILSAVTYDPLDLDTDFSAFIRADGESMRNREAYITALGIMKIAGERRLQDSFADTKEDGSIPSAAPAVDGELEENSASEYHWQPTGQPPADDLGNNAKPVETEPAAGRRLASFTFVRKELEIIYLAKGGDALDEKVLGEIRDFERSLNSLPEWSAACFERVHSKWAFLCNPGHSIGVVVWPSASKEGFRNTSRETSSPWSYVNFDAKGQDPMPVPVFLEYLKRVEATNENYELKRYFPKGFRPPALTGDNSDYERPEAIRTSYTFKLLTGTTVDKASVRKQRATQSMEAYRKAVINEVYPLLLSSREKYQHIQVCFSGDDISDHEMFTTLTHDAMWALGSIVAVTAYIWVHTRSVLLSLSCFAIIFTSVPLAYVLMPPVKMTIASFVSLFLIIGIGSDSIFVFMDLWNQSADLNQGIDVRLMWMLTNAGSSCLATSLTTSVSFFANLASALQPLREFGLFMGLCVMSAFFLVLLFLPPIIVIHDRQRRRRKGAEVVHKVVDISRGDAGTLAVREKGCCRASGPKSDTSWRMYKLFSCVAHCPICVVSLAFATILMSIIGISAEAELDQGVPQIFPSDHNQVVWSEVRSKFETTKLSKTLPIHGGLFCGLEGPPREDDECAFHWCYTEPLNATAGFREDSSSAVASCWHGPTVASDYMPGWGTQMCDDVTVDTRLEAEWRPADTDLEVLSTSLVGQLTGGQAESLQEVPAELPPLAMEDWDSGSVVVKPLLAFSQAAQLRTTPSYTDCRISVVCFTGALKCELASTWRHLGNFTLPRPARRRAAGVFNNALVHAPAQRWLQSSPLVPKRKRIDISVIWGLRAPGYTPLVGQLPETWRYDPSFDPADPWAQRAMYKMCEGLPDHLEVVPPEQCWVMSFRKFLVKNEEKFPARDFETHLASWYPTDIKSQRHLWLVGGKLKACKFAFDVNVALDTSAIKGATYKEKWDHFVSLRNGVASTTANRAWHTAQLWVRVEAEAAIVGSTADTIIISAVCSWLGMLAFTGDPYISLLALFLVLGIIVCLAFFMINIMGWAIGPIEVISLVIFVGYSVTYTLHIAHNYSESGVKEPEQLVVQWRQTVKRRAELRAARLSASRKASASFDEEEEIGSNDAGGDAEKHGATAVEMRKARAWAAVQRVGAATLSSAASTVASSMFLLNCTLTVFCKLGAVVMAVTLLSILFALLALPALLILVGPGPDPCYRKVPRRAFAAVAERCGRAARDDGLESPPESPSHHHSTGAEWDEEHQPFVGGYPCED